MRALCWIAYLSMLTLLSRGQECIDVAKEGDEGTLNCPLANRNEGVVWQLQVGATYINISNCDSSGSCTNLMDASFRATRRRAPVESAGESFIDQLRIFSANRNQSTFKCIRVVDRQSQTCNLQVYVTTDTSTCESPSVIKIGTLEYLRVICSSESVYPRGNCTFRKEGLPNNITEEWQPSHNPSTSSPGNFKIQCSWLTPLSGLSQGAFRIQVEIYPSLYKRVEAAASFSDWTQLTTLNVPTVAVASDCPTGSSVKDGYISQGTQASCRCEVKQAGFPPGSAQWYDESGVKLGTNENDGSANLPIDNDSASKTYKCRSVSSLKQAGNLQEVSFSPKFAVGPTDLAIDMSDIFPVCPGQSSSLTITCRFPTSTVSPSALFTIMINNKTVVENQAGRNENSATILRYMHTPEFGGPLQIYCKAANGIFPDRFVEFVRQFVLNEPPRLAPELKTSNNQPEPGSRIAYVPDLSNVHVTCLVDGGYPKGSNIGITCGTNTIHDSGPVVSMTVSAPNGTKSLLCVCWAVHVTGCYDKRTEIEVTLGDPGTSRKDNVQTNESSNFSLPVALGVGLGCGFILVIVIIILVVILCKRKEGPKMGFRDMQYNQPDCPSCSSYQYTSPPPGRSDLPPLPPPNEPYQSTYDLIALDSDRTLGYAPKIGYGKAWKHESSTDVIEDNQLPEGYVQPI